MTATILPSIMWSLLVPNQARAPIERSYILLSSSSPGIRLTRSQYHCCHSPSCPDSSDNSPNISICRLYSSLSAPTRADPQHQAVTQSRDPSVYASSSKNRGSSSGNVAIPVEQGLDETEGHESLPHHLRAEQNGATGTPALV